MKFVTASEMQEIDRKTSEEFGILSSTLMENAGRSVAEEATKMLRDTSLLPLRGKVRMGDESKPPPLRHTASDGSVLWRISSPIKGEETVIIFCGKGNNGGDGFVAARYLHNRGMKLVVYYLQTPSTPDSLSNFKILEKMGVSLSIPSDWEKVSKTVKTSKLVIDALFGIGLSKPVEEPFKSAIKIMNESKVPVLSVDIPSGMNADTGEIMGVCVRAKETLTLGLPKKGFMSKGSRKYTGKVIVADISIPVELLE